MLVMTTGARFIGVTNDYRSLFSENDPQLALLDELENTYSVSYAALIAVAPREGSVFTRETLGAIEELSEAAWRAPTPPESTPSPTTTTARRSETIWSSRRLSKTPGR